MRGGGKRSVSDWGNCGFGAVIDGKLIELDGDRQTGRIFLIYEDVRC